MIEAEKAEIKLTLRDLDKVLDSARKRLELTQSLVVYDILKAQGLLMKLMQHFDAY